jgi:mono/diheme cytochrome c family protein
MIRTRLPRLALRAALFVSVAALLPGGAARAQSDLVKRGDYLVNTVLTCGNCHTPKTPQGADIMDKAFSGGLHFDEPPFDVTAANITPDKETGIGSWTDAQIKKLLHTGIKPNGTPVAAVMPTGFYDIMTERDLNSIVAYLPTLKPVKNKVPDPINKFPAPRTEVPGGDKPYTEAMLKNKLKKGFYLVTIAHCLECHTPLGPKGVRQMTTRLGAGGFELKGPWGVTVSRNITSSKDKGIGAWTEAEIKRAITTGVDKDGRHLRPPMGFAYYAKMTSGDLDAIVAFIRPCRPRNSALAVVGAGEVAAFI